jgi:hypothetical protein
MPNHRRLFLTLGYFLCLVAPAFADGPGHGGIVGICSLPYSLLWIKSASTKAAIASLDKEIDRANILLPSGISLKKLLAEYSLRSIGKFDVADPKSRGEFLLWVADHPELKPAMNNMGRPMEVDTNRLARLRDLAQKSFKAAEPAKRPLAAGLHR